MNDRFRFPSVDGPPPYDAAALERDALWLSQGGGVILNAAEVRLSDPRTAPNTLIVARRVVSYEPPDAELPAPVTGIAVESWPRADRLRHDDDLSFAEGAVVYRFSRRVTLSVASDVEAVEGAVPGPPVTSEHVLSLYASTMRLPRSPRGPVIRGRRGGVMPEQKRTRGTPLPGSRSGWTPENRIGRLLNKIRRPPEDPSAPPPAEPPATE